MIIYVYDVDNSLIAQGQSYYIKHEANSLISISSGLYRSQASFGILLGSSTELRKAKEWVEPTACVTFIMQHANGLCFIYHPRLGPAWVMPSALHYSKVFA